MAHRVLPGQAVTFPTHYFTKDVQAQGHITVALYGKQSVTMLCMNDLMCERMLRVFLDVYLPHDTYDILLVSSKNGKKYKMSLQKIIEDTLKGRGNTYNLSTKDTTQRNATLHCLKGELRDSLPEIRGFFVGVGMSQPTIYYTVFESDGNSSAFMID